MANMTIKIDLLKLVGKEMTVQGKSGPVTGIFIPYDANYVYVGEKGRYLKLTAVELKEPKYEDTHFVKLELDKSVRDAMTEEQRKAIPIVGGAKYWGKSGVTATASAPAQEVFTSEETKDLPF
jgi:hypothetical protein